MVGPILEEISDEMANDVSIAKHNIDEEPNAQQNMVLEVYLQCYFSNGKID